MEIVYLTQPPKRYTFEQPKLREWVEQNSILPDKQKEAQE